VNRFFVFFYIFVLILGISVAEEKLSDFIIGMDYEGLEKMLNESENPNQFYKNSIVFGDRETNFPLITLAVVYSDHKTISILLKHLANPNAQLESGETPIMFAVMTCRSGVRPCEEKIRELLKYGANPFLKAKNGLNAYDIANSNEYKNYVSDDIKQDFQRLKNRIGE
jgi:ankyrin repeat protein